MEIEDLLGETRKRPKTVPYEYVKRYYSVPAEPGKRVKMAGHRPTEEGVIVRKRCYDQYVHVRFDGQSFDVPVHPMDLEYL
jgi:hypothetical protein